METDRIGNNYSHNIRRRYCFEISNLNEELKLDFNGQLN